MAKRNQWTGDQEQGPGVAEETPRPPLQSPPVPNQQSAIAEDTPPVPNPQSTIRNPQSPLPPLGPAPTGYVSRRVDGQLTPKQAETLARLTEALSQQGATIEGQHGPLPVGNSRFRALQYLLDCAGSPENANS